MYSVNLNMIGYIVSLEMYQWRQMIQETDNKKRWYLSMVVGY